MPRNTCSTKGDENDVDGHDDNCTASYKSVFSLGGGNPKDKTTGLNDMYMFENLLITILIYSPQPQPITPWPG